MAPIDLVGGGDRCRGAQEVVVGMARGGGVRGGIRVGWWRKG